MQRLKLLGIIILAACFVFSTSVAFAKANDDDDEDDAPVVKTHTAKTVAKAAKDDEEDDDEDEAPVAKPVKTKTTAKTEKKADKKEEKKTEATAPAAKKDTKADKKSEATAPATKSDKKDDKKTEAAAATKAEDKAGLLPCPASIQVAPQEIGKKIEGWHSFTDEATAFPLDTVALYIDDKKAPVKLDPSKGTESFTEWQLLENGKEHYYMVCSYSHTSVLLKRELDKGFASCRLSFEQAATSVPQQMHKLTCQ